MNVSLKTESIVGTSEPPSDQHTTLAPVTARLNIWKTWTRGRMMQMDPYATLYSSHTPYNYAMNNPIGFNDPTGGKVKPKDERAEPPSLPEYQNVGGGGGSGGHWWTGTGAGFSGHGDSFKGGGGAGASGSYTTTDPVKIAQIINAIKNGGSIFVNGNSLEVITMYHGSLVQVDEGGNPISGEVAGGATIFDYDKYEINGEGLDPRSEFAAAFGFGTNIAELYRQGYGAVRFGTSVQNAEKLLKNGKFINYNGKIYSNKFFGNQFVNSKAVEASKNLFNKSASLIKGAGTTLTVLSAGAAAYQFYGSDRSGADYARLGGAALITGSAFIPVVGPFISIGLGIADSYGAFDGLYNSFDN